jgi:hypothetical protein
VDGYRGKALTDQEDEHGDARKREQRRTHPRVRSHANACDLDVEPTRHGDRQRVERGDRDCGEYPPDLAITHPCCRYHHSYLDRAPFAFRAWSGRL